MNFKSLNTETFLRLAESQYYPFLSLDDLSDLDSYAIYLYRQEKDPEIRFRLRMVSATCRFHEYAYRADKLKRDCPTFEEFMGDFSLYESKHDDDPECLAIMTKRYPPVPYSRPYPDLS